MQTRSLNLVRIPRFLGPLLLAAGLSACNLLIPENPSAPRYNDVLGQPRAPQLNPVSSGGPSSNAAPMGATEMNARAFPPVDATTEVRANEIMASDVPPPPMPGQQAEIRQMPEENLQGTQVAGNYPQLNSVPPAPSMGADGDAARLARVRAQLEAERNGADAARNKLAADAAAEPSLLNTPMPPAPAPMGAPLPPQSSTGQAPGAIALLPPPPPAFSESAGTSWDRSAPAITPVAPPAVTASAAPAIEPIVLRAPVAVAPSATAPSFGYSTPAPATQSSSMAPAMAGGFNPMAGSEPITLRAPTSYANGTAYLPDSRYSTRRN